MAIHTSLLIAGSGIYYRSVGEHGPPFIRDIQEITMAFLALFIPERRIGCQPVFLVVVFILCEMNNDILNAMGGLGVEKIEGVLWGWQMAIHTIRNKALRIIYMGGCFPGVVSKLDFMAPGAKLRCGGSHHGEVSHTKKREGDDDPNSNKNGRLYKLFPGRLGALRSIFRFFHVFSQNR